MSQLLHTTELDAVNAMLAALGEAGVNSLAAPLKGDAADAFNTLRNASREVQLQEWAANTEPDYPLLRTVEKEIVLPPNCFSVRLAREFQGRLAVIPRGTRLYNLTTHTFEFPYDLKATLRFLLSWQDLPEYLRPYIYLRAARRFVDGNYGAADTHYFTEKDETTAMLHAKSEDSIVAAMNIFGSGGSLTPAAIREHR